MSFRALICLTVFVAGLSSRAEYQETSPIDVDRARKPRYGETSQSGARSIAPRAPDYSKIWEDLDMDLTPEEKALLIKTQKDTLEKLSTEERANPGKREESVRRDGLRSMPTATDAKAEVYAQAKAVAGLHFQLRSTVLARRVDNFAKQDTATRYGLKMTEAREAELRNDPRLAKKLDDLQKARLNLMILAVNRKCNDEFKDLEDVNSDAYRDRVKENRSYSVSEREADKTMQLLQRSLVSLLGVERLN